MAVLYFYIYGKSLQLFGTGVNLGNLFDQPISLFIYTNYKKPQYYVDFLTVLIKDCISFSHCFKFLMKFHLQFSVSKGEITLRVIK